MKVSAKRNVKKLLQKTCVLIFVLMMMLSSQANLNSFNSDDDFSSREFGFDKIKTQAPLEDSNLNTGAINVTIQQTYTNITDVSLDQDSDSFYASAPTDSDYLSQEINIAVKDLGIQNYTDTIEDSHNGRTQILDTAPVVTSFYVPMDCYLVNASFDLRPLGGPEDLRVRVWNSTWTGSVSKPSGYYDYEEYGNVTVDSIDFLESYNDSFYLDNSKTDNNTWFIGLYDESTPSFRADWYHDDDLLGDGNDETRSYVWATSDWSLITDISTVDLSTKLSFSLKSSTPDPTDINLMINGTAVDDTTTNKGEWVDTTQHSGSSGKLNFTFSSDWYDFSLDIDEVNIDYVKSTFDELTEYSVELNELVYWNSSVNITEFDSKFSSNEINFTIPYDWTVTDVQNETSSITYSTTSSQPTKTVRVTGASATNGKWALEASSANYGSSVSSYVGGSAVSLADYSDDVSFRATFDDVLSGDVNLSVYDPSQSMKYTFENSSVSNKQTIYFPSYDLSDNVTEYGEYSIQTYWMNTTHIGYWEDTFTVVADTSLSLISPAQSSTYNPTDTFTIALYFEDTGITSAIDGATIYYTIDGDSQQSFSTNNGTSGYYEIDVDCNTITGTGDKVVEITSNKTYYNNQTLDYNFHINEAPDILTPATLQGDSSWTQDEDFGYFNFDFSSYEYDTEDNTIYLDWTVSGVDSSLFSVGNETADDDVLTFYSVQDAFGSDQFTAILTDSGGLTDTILITLTVNSVNDDPVIQNPSTIQSNSSWTQDEDFGSFDFYLSSFESDVEDSDTNLDWYVTGLDTSLVTISGEYSDSDVLTFSSVSNAYGSDPFTLWLVDSGVLADSVSITITVNSVNDDPIIQNPSTIQGNSSWTQDEDFGSFDFYLSSFESDIEDSDTDLDWYVTGLDTSLITVSGEYSDTDVLTFSSESNEYGSDTFTLWLVDSGVLTDSVSITIIVNSVNDDPIIQNPSTIQGNSSWTQDEDFGSFGFYLSSFESDVEDSDTNLDWYITGLDTSLVTVSGEYSDTDVLTFSSESNAYGSDTFTLWLVDSGVLTDSVSITITINSVNDDPIIQNPSTIQGNSSWTQDEDFGSFDYYLSSFESDIEDSDTSLDWYITGLDTSLVTVSGEYSDTDVLTFSSESNEYGSDTFTLWLVDSGGLTDSVSITITVNPVNDDPVIQNPSTIQGNSSWNQDEDFGSFNFYLSDFESDIEDSGTALDWYVTGLDTSLVTISGENSDTDMLTFSSVSNEYGSDTFTLWLVDSGGLTDSVSITITVNPVNDDPVIQNPSTIQSNSSWTQDEDFGSFDFYLSNFESDVEDSDTSLDWYVTGLDTSLVTISGEYSDTDVLTFSSVSNAYGSDTFTLWLVDSGALTDSVSITITVNPVNDDPIIQNPLTIQGNSSWTQDEDFGTLDFYLSSFESDIEDSDTSLDWYITGLDTSLVTISGEYSDTDVLTFSSVSNAYGSDTFTLWLVDSGGLTDSVSITITVNSVNDDPVIQNPLTIQGNSSWTQDEDFGSFDFHLSSFESDIEDSGTALDWYVTGLDTSLVTISGEYSDTDVLTFSSVSNEYGSDTFTLWLVDSGVLTDSVEITITVNSINDDPVIQNPSTIQGNSSWTQDEDFGSFDFYLSSFESDIEDSGTNLDWYITGLDTSLVTISGENSDTDILTFSSVSNEYGSDTFTLWLVDSGGLTDSVSITITVNSINDDPVIQNPSTIQSNSSWTQDEDFGSFDFHLSSFESDIEDSDTSLDWYITGLDTSLVTVSGEYSDTDVLIFNSISNVYGSDTFTLWLVDSGGLTDSVSITITVNSVNDDPVIQNPSTIQGNSSWTQDEDFGSFDFHLSSFESDIEDSGTALDWYVTGLDASLVTISGEYSDTDILTFSSVSNAHRSDTFTLWLVDSGVLTDSVSITITVNSINDDPVITDPVGIQSNSTWVQIEDFSSFTFDFTPYESDIENSTTDLDWYITGLNTSLVTVSGEYSDNDVLTFSSVLDATGTDEFTVWLVDADGATDNVVITINVGAENDNPVILNPSTIQSNSSWTQDEDFGSFDFYLSSFESDIEDSGTALDWYVSGLDTSLVTISGEYSDNDMITFYSVANATGTDEFTLWLVDSGGFTDSVSITITINGVNDNPWILSPILIQGNSSWTQNEDFGTFDFYLTDFENDLEDSGTDLDWYVTGLDTSLVTISGENSDTDILTFSSVSNAYGSDTFTLWLVDSGVLTDSVSITITVNSVNDDPVIQNPSTIQGNSSWTQDEDFGSFDFYLSSFESDIEDSGTDLDWYVTGLDTSLITISGENSDTDVLTFSSVPNAYGSDTFTLWLVDSGVLTDSVSITITVNPVNDDPIIQNPSTIQGNSSWTQDEDFGSFDFYLSSFESDIEDSGTDLDWYVTGLDTSLVTISGENSDIDVLTFSSISNTYGSDTFTLWLVDSGGLTDSVSITITVNPVNDDPIIQNPSTIQGNSSWTQDEEFGSFDFYLSSFESDIEDSGTDLDWYVTGLDTSLVTISGEYSDTDVLTFSSISNAYGSDTFTLWLVDSGALTDSVSITITVNPINDDPVIQNPLTIQGNSSWTQEEDFGSFDFYLSSFESDIEDSGTDLDWYVTGLDTSLVTISGENSDTDVLTFSSISNVYGSDTFTLWLVDSGGLTDSVEITITVNSVNDDPVIQNPSTIQGNSSWTQDEDFGSFDFYLSSFESDIEDSGTDLDWYATGLDTSLVTISGEYSDTDILTFTSVSNAHGSDTFTLWLVDSEGLTNSVSITITINPINDDPVIQNPLTIQGNSTWTQDEDFGSFDFYLSSFESDIEDSGTDLDWYVTSLDTSLVTFSGENSDTDVLTFSSVSNAYGSDIFTLWLVDSGGLTDSVEITITVNSVNDDPVIQNPSIIQGNSSWTQDEDFGSFDFYLSSFEGDIEDSGTDLDWYVTGLDTSLVTIGGEYSDNDVLTFSSISNAYGSDTFTLWLVDSGALTDSVSITITVNPINDDPVIQNPLTIQGNSTWTQDEDFGTFDFYLSDYESDIEDSGTALDWYVSGLDTSLITISGENSDTDVLTFSSVSNAYGSDTFTLWLVDSGVLTDSVEITITVNSVNDDPVIQNPSIIQGNSSWTQDEDFGSFDFYLSDYESDVEDSGTSLDWYITGLNTSLVTISGEYSDNDVLTFSSVLDATGFDEFTVWLVDADGSTDSVVVTMYVGAENDNPVILNPSSIQSNSSWTQDEDFGSFDFYLSSFESDTENSGTSLDWYITGLDTSLVTVNGEYSDTDVLSFSSVTNAHGSDTFTLWLVDSGGLTDSVSITITINPINDDPVIQNPSTIQGNSSWTQDEDFGSFQFHLSSFESDTEDSGTSLDWYITGLNTSLVTVSGEYSDNDVLIFSSVLDAAGTDEFTLWLVDSGGFTDSIQITIQVNKSNNEPEPSNWLPYAGIGGGGFVVALFSTVLVSRRRKKKKSQKMQRDVDKKIEDKEISEEEETFEDLLEKEKEAEEEQKEKVDTEEKAKEAPKSEEESKDSEEKATEETVVEEKKGKSKKQKDASKEEKSEQDNKKKPTEDSTSVKEKEISFNSEDPVEENIEKMLLHQITEKTHRSKNSLWKAIEDGLKEMKITVNEDQIQQIFEKLRKDKKIGFDSKVKPTGWKLKKK